MTSAAVSPPPFERVGIAGIGLIGGSIALAIKRQWPSVRVIGVDVPAVAAAAVARHVIDEARASVSELSNCDLVILAAPVTTIVGMCAECAGFDGLVADVGSTKRRIMAAARGAGIRRFVGSHPMAGKAEAGLEHAEASLFDGRPWLLVAGEESVEDLRRLSAFVSALGAAPAEIDAGRHDRLVAHVSHLPQLLATTLMASAGEALGEPGLALAGQGFADMTRLSSSPAAVWQGILATNADFIAEAARDFVRRLPTTAEGLTDEGDVTALFDGANAWKARARRAVAR